MSTPRGGLAVAVAAGLVVALAPSASAAVSPTPTRTWGVDGRVSALVNTTRGVVVGGDFAAGVSPTGATTSLGNVGLWNPATGTFVSWPVTVTGQVLAVAVSGDTVYLGGSFSRVNGAARVDLAAVSLSTGALLPWRPEVGGGQVEALAAGAGQVYLGGSFTSVRDGSTTSARYLARVSAAGTLDRTWTGSISLAARVRALQLAPNGALYVGGAFESVNGTSAFGRTVKVGTGTQATVDTGFRSGPNNGRNRSEVIDLALSGSDLLVAAGGGGGGCALQSATTGATRWTIHANGNVQAVAAVGTNAYCGGHFGGSTGFDGKPRQKIAEVVLASGTVTSWAPRVNSPLGVWALTATSSGLVAGGDFTKIGSTRQPHLAVFGNRP